MGIERDHHGVKGPIHHFIRRQGAGLWLDPAHSFDRGINETCIVDFADIFDAHAGEHVPEQSHAVVVLAVLQVCPVDLLESPNFPVFFSGQNVIVRGYGPNDAAERRIGADASAQGWS